MFRPFVLTVYCCVVVLESCVQAICAVYCCVVVLESCVQAICADCVLLCCSLGELCSSHLC